MAAVTLDNLAFRYPGAPSETLTALNLSIADGEAHALLGASGAGKTTLLNLLSGLLAPTSGALRFGETDVSHIPGRERNVAQVFQFPVLYESLSVAENLVFPLRTRGATPALVSERQDYIASELDLGDVLALRPARLSLFQKQLVAVGKALIRPDVALVLLDEPLTAVEPRVKWRLRQSLKRAQKDLGVTMIYVTHDQTEALTFAERVSVLKDGGILQTGTPEEVYAEPAHEFVGHFVGSPGMNFLPAEALGVPDAERIGFRPEWAQLLPAATDDPRPGTVVGHLQRIRVQGTQAGRPYGLLTLETPLGVIAVRDVLPEQPPQPGSPVAVRLRRCSAFSGQRRQRNHEFL